ncbi:MAG: glycerol-3-phosphate dehydrogenase/oxidase [Anaerolineae bacterium]|nr:glycerol-3-phosphate dehydrogenase/oxidase [Anaerolineae bacterium]
MTARETIWNTLRRQPAVSVLIVGAGINGAGVFRELALQGVDALLIDRSDFCAGTSAASGRVIHGGIRYLENGEFRLVREALLERQRLLNNAPHYVQPLPATIPVFGWLDGAGHAARQFLGRRSRPGNRGALIIKAGLVLYDIFAGRDNTLPRHRLEGRRAALARRPPLNPNIVATATYYDARLDNAERLCLEVIQDGEAAHPAARALNYVTVASARGATVLLRDTLTGETLPIQPQIVVNATGAWIDFTNQALGRPTALIGGTKGSHVVVDHPALHALCQGQMFHFVTEDGRLTIFYPLGDKVLLGTTDIPITDPDTAVCDDDETAYILGTVRRVFPSVTIDPAQIVFRFSGVRPLPRSDALTPGQISRDHSYPLTPPGDGIAFPVYSLVGGKWTTFRAFSEQVADVLLPHLGAARRVHTHTLPIGGGTDYPATDSDRRAWLAAQSQRTGVAVPRLAVLLARYGTRAATIAAFIAAGEDAPLTHHAAYSRREILYLAQQERVVHLDDLLLRRTMLGMLGEVSGPLLAELADLVAQALDWSPAQHSAALAHARRILREKHGVTL